MSAHLRDQWQRTASTKLAGSLRIYRGVNVELTHDQWDRYVAEVRRGGSNFGFIVDIIKAHAITYGHGSNAGVHWTSSIAEAYEFAVAGPKTFQAIDAPLGWRQGDPNPYATGKVAVMMTGSVDPEDVVTDEETLKRYWVLEREQEVPLRVGASIRLESIEVAVPATISADDDWHRSSRDPVRWMSVRAGITVVADATNWRALQDHPIWQEHDAVILTQMRGRDRYYEVYTYGEVFGHYPRLDDAKAALEAIYGPLGWSRVRMPRVWAEHYYFGWTDEFTDPLTAYVVDNLPRLGKVAATRPIYRGVRVGWMDAEEATNLDGSELRRIVDRVREPLGPHFSRTWNVAFQHAVGTHPLGHYNTEQNMGPGKAMVGIILHCQVDESDHLRPGDPEREEIHRRSPIFADSIEQEVTVRPGAQVRVTMAEVAVLTEDEENVYEVSYSRSITAARDIAEAIDSWIQDGSMEITHAAVDLVEGSSWSRGGDEWAAKAARFLLDAVDASRPVGTLYSGHVERHNLSGTAVIPLMATTPYLELAEGFAYDHGYDRMGVIYTIKGARALRMGSSENEYLISGVFSVDGNTLTYRGPTSRRRL